MPSINELFVVVLQLDFGGVDRGLHLPRLLYAFSGQLILFVVLFHV